jgi:hypothetical protein
LPTFIHWHKLYLLFFSLIVDRVHHLHIGNKDIYFHRYHNTRTSRPLINHNIIKVIFNHNILWLTQDTRWGLTITSSFFNFSRCSLALHMTNVANGSTQFPLVHRHQAYLFVPQHLSIGTNLNCHLPLIVDHHTACIICTLQVKIYISNASITQQSHLIWLAI